MKLTTKLTLSLSSAIVFVLSIDAFLGVRRESALFAHNMRNDHQAIGRTVAAGTARAWRSSGETDGAAFVSEANQREGHVSIRWVWLDAPDGHPRRPELAADEVRQLEAGQIVALRWLPGHEDSEVLSTFMPVVGPRPTAIEIRQSLEEERAYLRQTVLRTALYAAALLFLTTLAVQLIGLIFVARPVRELVAHARRVGAGELSARLESTQQDEIGTLAKELNQMADQLAEAKRRVEAETEARLAATEQLQHAERLSTLGKLASGVAHEMGTPLNVIAASAELITEGEPPGSPSHRNAGIIAIQAQRLTAIIRQLLDFARRRKPSRTRQDIGCVLQQSVSMMTSLARKRNVELLLRAPAEGLRAVFDPGQICQVVTNLLVNGIHSMPSGGTVTLGAEPRVVTPPAAHGGPAAEYLRLYVKDEGSGIAPDVLPRVFDPFFTTKEPGEGTGLGLSVAYGIVREHDGWIGIETEVGKGSSFSVYLPMEKPNSTEVLE